MRSKNVGTKSGHSVGTSFVSSSKGTGKKHGKGIQGEKIREYDDKRIRIAIPYEVPECLDLSSESQTKVYKANA